MTHIVMATTNKQKKQLFQKIAMLCKTEHEEIYKIIKNHNTVNASPISFSQNRNGIFFNLSDIDDKLYLELDGFVNFCITNKKDLDDYDKKINECKINNNYSNIIQPISDNVKLDPEQDRPEDWNTIITEPKSVQRVQTYIEKLMNEREGTKKKINQKFNNAKKKFAKKITNDKKIDAESLIELQSDAYLNIT